MGRGRAKAKQAKVARRLKYGGGGTDLERLRREMGTPAGAETADTGADQAGDVDREGAGKRTGE
ncbi:MAG: DUF3073 family protein [Stackebrandtia sp.]